MPSSQIADSRLFPADHNALVARGKALLDEAVLRALQRHRLDGYLTLDQLSTLLDWNPPDPESPQSEAPDADSPHSRSPAGADDYSQPALLWVLRRLYREGRVEPAHPMNVRGNWGGWRITLDEYLARLNHHSGEDGSLDDPTRHYRESGQPGVYPGEWVSLAQCPRPWSGGPYANPPALIRMPDGAEYLPGRWRHVLPLLVEWLNERGLLKPGHNVPFARVQGQGVLVNTTPDQGDGLPMETKIQAGGPDRLWVNLTNSTSQGHHAIAYGRRLMRACGQRAEDVQFWFRRSQTGRLPPSRTDAGFPRPAVPAADGTDAGIKRVLWLTLDLDAGELEIWKAEGRP